jgi:hypothetical protein
MSCHAAQLNVCRNANHKPIKNIAIPYKFTFNFNLEGFPYEQIKHLETFR